jgi:predicted deacylase
VLLGEQVDPGTSVRLSWSPDQRFEGIAVPTAVLVVNGVEDGPTLCLTAAIHGDELNGIEIVRRVLYGLDPDQLSGTVIGVPIVNLQGFRRGSRYLPDRRDLNRFFPGTDYGSSASRIAYSFFNEVIRKCDALVDVHTGSFARTNLPQLRADMKDAEVAKLTQGFGATSVLHSAGAIGTLRRAATDRGIPAVTIETGEPTRLQETKIAHGTRGIETLLNHLGMHKRVIIWGEPEPVYYQSTWVRADRGGLLFGDVDLGQRVRKGEVLGTVTDPITNLRSELRAPEDGRVLGMALNQVVMPGFAAFRIGIPTTDEELASPETAPAPEIPPDEEEIGESGGDEAPVDDEEAS